jgi:hypothetical protein
MTQANDPTRPLPSAGWAAVAGVAARAQAAGVRVGRCVHSGQAAGRSSSPITSPPQRGSRTAATARQLPPHTKLGTASRVGAAIEPVLSEAVPVHQLLALDGGELLARMSLEPTPPATFDLWLWPTFHLPPRVIR